MPAASHAAGNLPAKCSVYMNTIVQSGLEDAIREAPSSLTVSEEHKMLRVCDRL